MNILAFDTSSQACSVAIKIGDEMFEHNEVLENRHSKFLLEIISELLQQADLSMSNLDVLAVGNGPGSFTGLRLGLGVAQGLAFGINKPLLPISSVHAIAQTSDADNVLVAVDARMGEVYWQCFTINENGQQVALDRVKLDRPENICIQKKQIGWQGIGSGFDEYADRLSAFLQQPDDFIENAYPSARSIIELAQVSINETGMPAGNSVLPVYVRDNVTD